MTREFAENFKECNYQNFNKINDTLKLGLEKREGEIHVLNENIEKVKLELQKWCKAAEQILGAKDKQIKGMLSGDQEAKQTAIKQLIKVKTAIKHLTKSMPI